MAGENRGNAGFGAGVPELLILRLLQEREMYGYEIVQAIDLVTQGAVAPGEGVVYPLLHALEKDGALRAEPRPAPQPAGGRTRIYYTLTSRGVRRLFDLSDDWNRLARAVTQALKAPN
jgi:PadR family transcriptional regulator PadR